MKSPIKYAPLSSGFMFISIIGFFISIWLVMDKSESLGFSFALIFVIMFISSIVSMTKAEPIPEHIDALKIHPPKRLRKQDGSHNKGMVWYEYLLLVYLAAWIFFIYMSLSEKIYMVNSVLTVIFLIVTFVLIMAFVVDATSDDKLSNWEQILFTLILVFTAGLGIFVYYVYKRIKY